MTRQQYITKTRERLRGYRALTYYCQVAEERIQDTYETATNVVPPYGERIGHSDIEKPNPGAILADNRRFQEDKRHLEISKRELRGIDGAISLLLEPEQTIIKMLYCQPHPANWTQIAKAVNFSARQCQRYHGDALAFLIRAFFGAEAM